MRLVRWIVRTAAPPLVLVLLAVCALFVIHARPSAQAPAAVAVLVVFAAGAYAADELQLAPTARRRVRRASSGSFLRAVLRSGAVFFRRCSRPSDSSGFRSALAPPSAARLLPLRT